MSKIFIIQGGRSGKDLRGGFIATGIISELEVVRETEKAINVSSNGLSCWFPKSALEKGEGYHELKRWFKVDDHQRKVLHVSGEFI